MGFTLVTCPVHSWNKTTLWECSHFLDLKLLLSEQNVHDWFWWFFLVFFFSLKPAGPLHLQAPGFETQEARVLTQAWSHPANV